MIRWPVFPGVDVPGRRRSRPWSRSIIIRSRARPAVFYTGIGWQVEVYDTQTVSDPPGTLARVTFKKPLGQSAYLWYCSFRADGQALEVPPNTVWERLASRFRRPPQVERFAAVYQVQLFAESAAPLSAEHQQELERLFLATRRQFARVAVPR